MRWLVRLIAAAVVLAAGMGNAQAPVKRIALVIGNAAYTAPGWQLVNPVNDAQLIAARLKPLGFEVMTVMNATHTQMDQAFATFAARLRAAGPDAVGFFYYAGHGVEFDGANLLVPVDVTAATIDDLRYQAQPLQFVLRDMARAGNAVNIVVLDACRDTPLPSGHRAGARGLTFEDVPNNVLIAFATGPGRTTPDNPDERNTVFTRILAEALATNADEPVENLFSYVGAKVHTETRGRQLPEFRSRLYRAPSWGFASALAPPTIAAPSQPALDLRQAELAYWNSCCGSDATAEDLDGYLGRVSAQEFPGTYADTARRRTRALRAAPVSVSQPPPLTSAVAVQKPFPQAGQTIRDCPECPEMIVLPAGSFVMGSPASEERYSGCDGREEPQHNVSIQSFAVSKFEIKFAQWDACVAGGGCRGYRPDDQGWGRGNQPVINVSWNDVQSYVTWINRRVGSQQYRLLTESEWEYAARAGSSTAFSWGDTITPDQARYWYSSSYGGSPTRADPDRAAPVGTYAANAFGLYDMHGNVWEWVQDCWINSYDNAASDGSAYEPS